MAASTYKKILTFRVEVLHEKKIKFVFGPKPFRPREEFVTRKWKKFRWLALQTLTVFTKYK